MTCCNQNCNQGRDCAAKQTSSTIRALIISVALVLAIVAGILITQPAHAAGFADVISAAKMMPDTAIAAMAMFIIAQMGDAWTTWVIIDRLGGRELNPFAAAFMRAFGGTIPGLLVMKLILVGAMFICALATAWAPIAGSFVYAWVIWHNGKQIK